MIDKSSFFYQEWRLSSQPPCIIFIERDLCCTFLLFLYIYVTNIPPPPLSTVWILVFTSTWSFLRKSNCFKRKYFHFLNLSQLNFKAIFTWPMTVMSYRYIRWHCGTTKKKALRFYLKALFNDASTPPLKVHPLALCEHYHVTILRYHIKTN